MPTTFAIVRTLQCVAAGGVSFAVFAKHLQLHRLRQRLLVELENGALDEIFQRALDFNAGLGVKVDRTRLRVFMLRR